ncbi:MAG: hypothetical protein RLZ12_326 [Bacillota bacterium]|jgi:putative endonuclease
MFNNKKIIGQMGEQYAKEMLLKEQYQFVAQNFYTKLGELDLIFSKDSQLIFVEVRSSLVVGLERLLESINWSKQQRLRQMALVFLQQTTKIKSIDLRFDVVAIRFKQEIKIKQLTIKEIQHFIAAF